MHPGEYSLDDMPPAARHMEWSECYSIAYRYPSKEERKAAGVEDLGDWLRTRKEIVHIPWLPYMAWVETDEEDWIKSLGDIDDWKEITIEREKEGKEEA